MTIAARFLILGVRVYQWVLAPLFPPSCRFEPTCSNYALQALERHGAALGSYLMVRRIARCQPWCAGGHDPVPDELPRELRLFSRWTTPARPSSSRTREHS